LSSGVNVNAHATFTNNWSTGMGVNANGQTFDDRGTRGGPGVYGNSQRSFWNYLTSDERHAVSAGINSFRSTDRRGSGFVQLNPFVNYRPSSFLKISAGLDFSRNHDESQWIEAIDGQYLFGRLRQKTVGVTARVNYTVTPALSIQIYAEPFVSAGDYSNFKALANGRSRSYDGRFTPAPYSGTPDFNYRSFRTTNVLRWEYKPGSTLFAVWQQGREDTNDRGTFNFSRDFGGVFSAPSRNVFLIKWAYWLNY
ncbi:MAG: DUF5916 domain-containing protein, partial [Acidobacteriota bacterium]